MVADRSVPVRPVDTTPVVPPRMPDFVGEPVVWPSPGTAVVELPSEPGSAGVAAVAGGLPVRVSPATGVMGEVPSARELRGGRVVAVPSRVRVEVLDRVASARVGAPVAVRVSRADGVAGSGRERVELDYSAFRGAFGADWAWRLGLVTVPECAWTSAVAESCAGFVRLAAANDPRRGVVSAEVDLPASGRAASPPLLHLRVQSPH